MKLSQKRQAQEKNYQADWSRYAKCFFLHSVVGSVSPYFFNSSNIFISASPFLGTYVIKLWPEQIAAFLSRVAQRHWVSGRRENGWGASALTLITASMSHKCWWEKNILYQRINIKSHFIWRKMHWCQTLIQFMSSAIFLGKHAFHYMTLLSRLSIATGNHPSLQNVAYSVLWKVKVFHCTKMTFNFSYLLVVLEWILADLMQFSSLAV